MHPPFSDREQERYSRHFRLPHLGVQGQQRLRNSAVLVIGVGGLGAPILQYLAAAGVGHIGLIDHDRVSLSNLQRQVLFGQDDLGKPKVAAAVSRLSRLNPHVRLTPFEQPLNNENALALIRQFDLVVDGSDNFPTRYLTNDACVLAGKPLVYGSVYRFEGQVSVFNLPGEAGRGPNYRDLFPEPPPPELVPDCAEGGVLGVLPGIIGSVQASEALKVLAGIGTPLSGRLWVFDALDFTQRTLQIPKLPTNPLTGAAPTIRTLQDYQAFCGLATTAQTPTISPDRCKQWLASGQCQLIDVREPTEHQRGNLGGQNIPLAQIHEFASQLSASQPIVLYCQTGIRSQKALLKLQKLRPELKLFSLENGFDNFYM